MIISLAILSAVYAVHHVAFAGEDPLTTSSSALSNLTTGNKKFVLGRVTRPNSNLKRVEETAKGQKPFACVLACSDSRVSPEILFDQGLGDLFVVRVAGNVADTDEIGSIEYAVGHLHAPILVVMGHTKCGAVTAVAEGAELPTNIKRLVDNIEPAVERSRKTGLVKAELVAHAVRENVAQSISDVLRRSEEVRHLVGSGKLKIYGVVYDIETGKMDWLDSTGH